MFATSWRPRFPLPKVWRSSVKGAVIHTIALAHYAICTRSWAADSRNARIRLKARLDQANQEIAMLREEVRIKDARMTQISPHRRPQYPPTERMAILELKAARAWSLEQTANRSNRHGLLVPLVASCPAAALAVLLVVPYRREAFQRELEAIAQWYNGFRAHTWLGGKTPDEAYRGCYSANRKARFEPRSRWPRGSPCAKPWALVRGSPGARLTIEVGFYHGRRHLPVVNIRRAA
jgi:hypothetical protein